MSSSLAQVAPASLHGLNAIQEEVKENVEEARRAIEVRGATELKPS